MEGEVVVLRGVDGAKKFVPKVGIVVGKLGYATLEQDDYVVKVYAWGRKRGASFDVDEESSELMIVAADKLTVARADSMIM